MKLAGGAVGVLGLALGVGLSFVPPRARQATPAAGVVRVGIVFDVGGRGDKSFNDAAYEGARRAERELGASVTFVEPTGAEDRESALRLFAARGYELVLGVGFIFSSDVDAVAKDFPAVRFACVDYALPDPGPNVAGLSFREEEGSFLVGALAGLESKSHRVGFVGGMVGPLIRRFEVGYEAGVHATCPSCIVDSAYAGTSPDAYRDPLKGKSLASAQIGRGVDIVFHAAGATGHGVFEAAKDHHIRAIGVDADQYDEMPGAVMTSMIKRVDVAVFDVVQKVVTGTFRGGAARLGLAEGGVDWVKDGPHATLVGAEARAKVEALKERVIAGSIVVPRD